MHASHRHDAVPRPAVVRCDEGSSIRRIPRAHLIFGRADVQADETRPFIRRAGVVWIGQSVFIAPEPDALELAEKLRGMGANVTMAPIAVDPSRFEEFRRRTLGRRAT